MAGDIIEEENVRSPNPGGRIIVISGKKIREERRVEKRKEEK